MARLPRPYEQFGRQQREVVQAYEALGEAAAGAGPLDGKTRELVKLGMSIGARLEGAVHSHTRRALEAGASAAEVRQVVALAAPTLGFPTTIAAFTWVQDILGKGGKRTGR